MVGRREDADGVGADRDHERRSRLVVEADAGVVAAVADRAVADAVLALVAAEVVNGARRAEHDVGGAGEGGGGHGRCS